MNYCKTKDRCSPRYICSQVFSLPDLLLGVCGYLPTINLQLRRCCLIVFLRRFAVSTAPLFLPRARFYIVTDSRTRTRKNTILNIMYVMRNRQNL